VEQEIVASKKHPEKEAIRISRILDASIGQDRYPVKVADVALELTPLFNKDPITEVMEENFNKIEGALIKVPSENRWGIFYNKNIKHTGRVRFTLAHEFGHYMLHREAAVLDGFKCSTGDTMNYDIKYKARETEANVFAAFLLMPRHDFNRQVKGERFSFDLMSHCANRYGVSLTSAVLRWLDFTSIRAIAILSVDEHMNWAKSSPKAFRSGMYFATRKNIIEVPAESAAAEHVFSMEARDGIRHGPGVWFEGQEVVEHTIYSEEYDKALTVLVMDSVSGRDQPDEIPEDDTYDRFMNYS
jgi:Zn-dependent peptidase ImmA (M78 family)